MIVLSMMNNLPIGSLATVKERYTETCVTLPHGRGSD